MGVGFGGGDSEPSSKKFWGTGSTVSSPSGVRGRAPVTKRFSSIASTQNDPS